MNIKKQYTSGEEIFNLELSYQISDKKAVALYIGAIHYEVMVLRHRKAKVMPNGSMLEAGWAFPSNEQWGTYGWTYMKNQTKKALNKYDALSYPGLR